MGVAAVEGMSTQLRISRYVPTMLTFAGAIWLAALFIVFREYPADDAYIHLRIAEHLAVHNQPYFNLNEPVMGSSSPLWTVLLAAIAFLPTSWTVKLVALELGIMAVCGVQARRFAQTVMPDAKLEPVLFSGAVVLLVYPSGMAWMETPLAIALWLAAARLLVQGKEHWGLYMGLAACVRAEMVWIGAVLALADLAVRGRIALRGWGWIVAAGIPFLAYDLWYFGTVVPAPMAAKSKVYQLTMAESAMTFAPLHTPVVAAAWAVAVGLGMAVLVRRCRPNQLSWAMLAGPASLVLIYLLKHTLVFSWYRPMVLVPLAAAVIAIGRTERALAAAVLVTLVSPFAWLGLKDSAALVTADRARFHRFDSAPRVRQYLRIARYLRVAHPGARLMAPEIGALGYAFRGPVLDAVGLVSPDAIEHHPMQVGVQRRSGGLGAIPATYVALTRPELVVALTTLAEDFSRSAVAAEYDCQRMALAVDDDLPWLRRDEIYGARSILVCVRGDLSF